MSNWIDLKIKDLFASSSPGDWGSEGSPETGVPVLRSTNFRNDGSIDFSDIAFRSINERRLVTRRVTAGTILIEKSGGSPTQAAGRVVYCGLDFNGTASNFIEVMKVKPDFDPRYVAYVLYYLYQIGLVLKYQQQTTGIINFKLNEYSEELIKCASSQPEQKKIAQILSTVDRAIEQTEALIGKQQRIKSGLMQDLFTRGIDEHGNLRSESTHLFKDSMIGRIPAEWDVVSLDRCVKNDSPICYGILMPGLMHEKGVPVIKVRDIKDGAILQDNILLTNPKIDQQYSRSRLHAGDLLITIRGTTGRIAIVPSELHGANITQDTARVRIRGAYSTSFFYFLMQSKSVQDQIALHTIGQAVKGINIADVKRLSFALPDLREQRAIAQSLEAIREALTRMDSHLRKLCSLKTALMQDLLTGRQRVTPLFELPLTIKRGI